MTTFQSPAFIVGKERSGTTLLSAILNRHSKVCVTPETDFLYQLSKYPGGSDGFKNDWPNSLYKIVDRMVPTADWNKPAKLIYDRVNGKALTGRDAFIELGILISEYYNKSYWIEKTPNHILCLPYIRSQFPVAPVIHIVRDGRDVAYSLTKVKFGGPSLYKNIHEWSLAVECAWDFEQTDANTISVRYEDLVQDPEGVISRVCDFLGLQYEPTMLKPDGTEKGLIDKSGDHMEQAATNITSSKLSAWKSNLTPFQQKTMVMLAHEQLVQWNYYKYDYYNDKAVYLQMTPLIINSRHNREFYDNIIEAISNASCPVLLSGVVSAFGKNHKKQPDILLTDELPLLYERQGGIRHAITDILKLIWKVMRLRLSGTSVIWIHYPNKKLSSNWRLRRVVEYIMSKASSIVIVEEEAMVGLAHDNSQNRRVMVNYESISVSDLNIKLQELVLNRSMIKK